MSVLVCVQIIISIILFSDPYCLIGILDKEHIESKAVRNLNLQDWEEQQLISNIYRSSVKEKTLDPEWNETFEL